MRKILHGAVLIFGFLFISSLHCVVPVSSGGSSSETVIGKVVNSDGSPACSTIVTLYPSDYDPIHDANLRQLTSDTTDANGAYSVEVRDSTVNYSIISKIPKSGVLALIAGITLKGDTTRIQDAILSRPGAILIPINKDLNLKSGYLYIPGTNIAVFLSSRSDYVILDSVPAGSILSIHYRADDLDSTTQVIKDSINVSSNDTINVSYTEWKFSQKLYLNTSPSGADITSNIFNFPILVRLNSGNFDFSDAQLTGADIRFTKADGSRLPYEIERWDAAEKTAEIWVKVDTVCANNATQSIVMRWGNPTAENVSDGTAVFDTANGFQGVWHLCENAGSLAKDATGNHFDGTPSDTVPLQVQGVIGSALQFNGISNGLVMKNTANSRLNFPRPGTYTFSAWVSVDSVYTPGDEMIAGKGFDQYALRIKTSSSVPSGLFALHEYVGAPIYGTEIRWTPLVLRQWKYVVGIRDIAGSYLFIDGECVDSIGTIVYGGGDPADTTNFSIGRCATTFASTTNPYEHLPFRGMVDEVRIASVHFSADWIKLSYMNQKSADRLIQFTK
jgi:hypothetical protein